MSNQIKESMVASFNYHLKDDEGNTLEISDSPLEYLHGYGNIIPGLEKELEGLTVGDKKTITVIAAEAYGDIDDDLINDVPRENFPADLNIEEGMQFQTDMEEGPMVVTVTHVGEDFVTVNGNHPMAGQDLTFEVEISGLREATPQELEHGHIHQGGHDH